MELVGRELHHHQPHLAVDGFGGEARCCQWPARGRGWGLEGDVRVVDGLGEEVDLG